MKQRKRKLGPWELSHKTYSFRVPPELHERVEALRKKTPLQEILLKGLGLVECEANAYDQGMVDGKEKGEKSGYARGKDEWYGRFEVPCGRCGKPMTFSVMRDRNHLAALDDAFARWVHPSCAGPVLASRTTLTWPGIPIDRTP